MLVLTRNVGESIVIDEDITITIGHINQNQVRVMIDAPREVKVRRQELIERDRRTEEAARKSGS